MSLQKVLDTIRTASDTMRDLGSGFESLMQRFLLTDPVYKHTLREVWLWSDFPYKSCFGGKDLGIDLVAHTFTGDYWAIQCKFYQEGTPIDQAAVSNFISNANRAFTDDEGLTHEFSVLLWIDTKTKWNANALEIIRGQIKPFQRLGINDLAQAEVDWDLLAQGKQGESARRSAPKKPREHQREAIERAHEHFLTSERGKLIMACGTGKTYTSLSIVEKELDGNGLALFLVPSIALLAQTIREWSNDATANLFPVCICSDASASKSARKKNNDTDDWDLAIADLPLPATTNVTKARTQLQKRFKQQREKGGLVVIFSTYQSIEVVHQLVAGHDTFTLPPFDIIVCDEAHRTAGFTAPRTTDSKDGYTVATHVDSKPKMQYSAFVKVHDSDYLPARRRLYMTATPKIYGEEVKKKAAQNVVELCSMDDEELFGSEIYRLSFGQAVEKGLLSDYKVIVLTIGENEIDATIQQAIKNDQEAIATDAAAKLIGCINALSKRMTLDTVSQNLKEIDPAFMHTALAFCRTISASQEISSIFNGYAKHYYATLTDEERHQVVNIAAEHVDGAMTAEVRQQKVDWLKDYEGDNNCHILTNVRCLSEGVDVPSLDAVIFLSARKSEIDVVQSVGRVMRRAAGKKYGYIIIPVVVAAGSSPEEALNNSKDFDIVWSVLNALRAHDDRFNAHINQINLNKRRSDRIIVGDNPPSGGGAGDDTGVEDKVEPYIGVRQLVLFSEWQNAIYARMVKKVGTRRYWEHWGNSVADIARRHVARIRDLVETDAAHKQAFERFLADLRQNLNPSLKIDDAIDMLAQHIITRPVFDALFDGYAFTELNAVSRAMNGILAVLDDDRDNNEADRATLQVFYNDIRQGVEGVDETGRQKVITDLYETFFKIAAKNTVEKLGIVYTPIPVVDFILKSVEAILAQEFHKHLTDAGVHILDPFTGTGTFIVRLLQLGLIKKEDLERKYTRELHANELVLLAYYIASINIESTYHDLSGVDNYEPFEGIVLTDTFQLGENDDLVLFAESLKDNSERANKQKNIPIRVIIGNPPYSVGQKSANDNAQNESYPKLEARLAETYVRGTNATNKNALYDSYIKAFRWASDRLAGAEGGIVAFVSNAGWLDGAAMDGMRSCFEREFSAIYVLNLRGNQRTQGEQSRKEGGKIFGSGSRTPVAITILVKNPRNQQEKATIYYRDIGDYLSREEKLAKLNLFEKATNRAKVQWQILQPNEKNDWLNQRSDGFDEMIALGDKLDKDNDRTIFCDYYSNGLKTQRDTWCYNFSRPALERNIRTTINFYNDQREKLASKAIVELAADSTKINWTRATANAALKNKPFTYDEDSFVVAAYRPFCLEWMYYQADLNEMVYRIPKLFPYKSSLENLIICVSGIGGTKDNSAFISDKVTDLNMLDAGTQCFPLYYYEERSREMSLFEDDSADYIRRDGITDFALFEARHIYGPQVTKEQIFYFVYGYLHIPAYRETFAADLKKSLPRLSFPSARADFEKIAKIGRELADLHLAYADQPAPEGVTVKGAECGDYRVEKMRFDKQGADIDKTRLIYNPHITIENIPLACYDYVVNGRSPIDWVIERYQVKIDKASQLLNDPNDWAREQGKPRYILDLLLSVMTVAIRTQELIGQLPSIEFLILNS